MVKTGEIVYIPVTIEDSQGTVESNADTLLEITVTGGELLGFGSANPRAEESYLSGAFTSYYGRALAVVACTVPGCLTVEVKGQGLESGRCMIGGEPIEALD